MPITAIHMVLAGFIAFAMSACNNSKAQDSEVQAPATKEVQAPETEIVERPNVQSQDGETGTTTEHKTGRGNGVGPGKAGSGAGNADGRPG